MYALCHLLLGIFEQGADMDAKLIIYGETAMDRLAQWLRTTGEPQDIDTVVMAYLDILQTLVREDEQ
jgi:hypothetical protein